MIKYYKIDTTLKQSDIKPPTFLGSTLRGAFGVALKRIVCINPSYKCDACFAKDECLFYEFYEEKNISHKYCFEFNLNQRDFNFSLYLFEDATKKLPYVISALHKMLTEMGLTRERKKFEIDSIKVNQKEIYKDENFDLQGIELKEFKPRDIKAPIKLEFLTPLRIKSSGKILSDKPTLNSLLNSIQNRLSELKDEPKITLTFTPTYKEKEFFIKFKDQTRRSNRQKTSLQIGGIIGFIEYEEIDENSLILLQIGEIIGIGKQTSFGMGRVKLSCPKNMTK